MVQKIADADLIDEIQRLTRELGRVPTVAEMNESGNYSQMPYIRRYGTWNAAVKAAGLEPTPQGGSIPEEALLNEIKRLDLVLGRPPTGDEMDELGRYHTQTYYNRFESWTAAKDKALSGEGQS